MWSGGGRGEHFTRTTMTCIRPQAGAMGYLLKGMPLPTPVEAIARCMRSDNFFRRRFRTAGGAFAATVVLPELVVLKAIARGMSNKEIGTAQQHR